MEKGQTGKKYTIQKLHEYDPNRHMAVEDAFEMVGREGLSGEKLRRAIKSRQITEYSFKGKRYLDRLDVGRVYHREPGRKSGLSIERYFTQEGASPFDSVEWTRRSVEITDFRTHERIFEMSDVEFPSWMDDNQASIVAQKYFYKPNNGTQRELIRKKLGRDHESSLRHLNSRVAKFFASEGLKRGYFASEEDAERFEQELEFLQVNGMMAFNTPVQINAGIYHQYGIEGSKSMNFMVDPKTGKAVRVKGGEYVNPQCHACFIRGPKDSLESIAQQYWDETAIFTLGSGVGYAVNKMRGRDEPLSGGGKSSGSISFLIGHDFNAGNIKSGGKSRRAARMAVMSQDHPDTVEFIRRKVREDKKALTLIRNGFSSGMDGEAYTTVALQNTNLSVRLDREFFRKVREGGDVEFRRVVDGKVVGKMSAERMLQELSYGSWRIGDPAVQYKDTIDLMHTCPNSGRQQATNPCSEYMFLDDTSCNLASLNLVKFLKSNGEFDSEAFRRAIRITALAQDIANSSASYPVRDIAQISPEFRTIGTGFANLGSLLMRKGIPYDSEEARAIAGAFSAALGGVVYETSTEMAKKLGTFVHYELNKKPMSDVIKKHRESLDRIRWDLVKDEGLEKLAKQSWENALERGKKNGFRNAQGTLMAPTGTISYLMGADTTGIEPCLALSIYKNLAGGGNLRLVSKDVDLALKSLGYNELQAKDITSHIEQRRTIIGAPHLSPDHYKVFETGFGDPSGNGAISFEGHIRMMAAIQPFLSGGISKTNNMPESATVKDVFDAYLLGEELGLKALSVFRDNSKPISALSFGERNLIELKRGEKEDLPSTRKAFEQEVNIDPKPGQEGTPLHIVVSEYSDGRPGQIVFLAYNSGSTLKAMLEIEGIQASKSLKRGVEIEDITSGWIDQKFDPQGIVVGHPMIRRAKSMLDFAAKWLRLEYKGMVEYADDPDKVDLTKLRGAKNGAFDTYRRRQIDDWDFEQVIEDPELGGFRDGELLSKIPQRGQIKKRDNGVICPECGNIMQRTSPNCYHCDNCSNKIGGCGF